MSISGHDVSSSVRVTVAAHATLQSGESAERGRAARRKAPRSAHGDWAPASDRPDPVAVLGAQAASRVQELVPIRYGRMLVSPFTFYRGAAAVMAADLADDAGLGDRRAGLRRCSHLELRRVRRSGPQARLRPERLRRDAARPVGVGRQADGGQRRDRRPRRRAAGGSPAADRDRVRAGVPRGDARLCAARATSTSGTTASTRASWSIASAGSWASKGRILFAKPFAKARRKTSLRAVKKLTERVDGELRFRSVPPLLVPLRELFDPADARDETDYVRELLDEYAASLDEDRRYLFGTYEFVDMARKVVGVGSVGTRAWVFLFVGRDGQGPARAAGEGGAGVGARALPGRERVREPRRAGRPRPADLARGDRHLPRAGSEARAWTATSTTSTSASSGTGRRRSTCRR